MRWSRLFPLLAAAGLALTWMAVDAQQPHRDRFVLTDREAILLSPPELVAAPEVVQAKWSPDARYILVARANQPIPPPGQGPAGDMSLVLWNHATHRSQEVWSRPAGGGAVHQVHQIEWLPRGGVAFAVATWGQPFGEMHRSLFRIDGSRTPLRVVTELAPGESLTVSPKQPLAVLVNHEKSSLRLIGSNGAAGARVPLPEGPFDTGWSPEGGLVVRHWERAAEPRQPAVPRWYAVDARGTLKPFVNVPAPPVDQPESLPIRLKQSTLALKEGNTTQTVRPLWLECVTKSEQPRALVCADAYGGQLAAGGDAVLYTVDGALWAVSLLRVPKQAFLEARRAALKTTAISNGKQIGLGLLMYLQDYDNTFPPAEGVIVDRIQPYVKNRQIFNTPGTDTPGFVYLQNVGLISAIAEPAKTQMGYVLGPGGRAVIYVDGHVEWQDD